MRNLWINPETGEIVQRLNSWTLPGPKEPEPTSNDGTWSIGASPGEYYIIKTLSDNSKDMMLKEHFNNQFIKSTKDNIDTMVLLYE